MWSRISINRFIYSFPVQLLVLLIKKNLVLLIYWLVLFGFITGVFAKTFGIPYLFLDPEYLGIVGFRSFFIIGVAAGFFIMVFNISSYIINGFRFPFIATLARPFSKYTMNNFIIPVLFIIVYVCRIFYFQLSNEYQTVWNALIDCCGFLLGATLVILFTLSYFFSTNKNIVKMFGVESSENIPHAPESDPATTVRNSKLKKFGLVPRRSKEWRVDTYLAHPFKVMLVRRTDHYKKEMLESVFRQNHFNAAVIEIVVFVLFIMLGLFKDYKMFIIPAGASIMLIFSLFIMLSSAFRFWLKAWTPSVLIFILLVLNILSGYGIFDSRNRAFGMNYDTPAAVYSLENLKLLHDSTAMRSDYYSSLKILNNWRNKFDYKPKLVFVNCSGGGLRASMWIFRVMQVSDSMTNGNFMNSAELITGASGGMIGASYYRELYLQHLSGKVKNFNDDKHLYNISKDLLNPVAFSITVSDLFFNIQKFREGSTVYHKDRAYAFEKQLNENAGNVFDKHLADYREPEAEAKIPMMIFSPTIVNDGRRLLISPQPVSYLTNTIPDTSFSYLSTVDGVEFRRFFQKQNADSIRFTSVLRMNATFPYILPAVTLPSDPALQIMDAGIRDNTGLKTSLRFLFTFRDWISENTSGVIFLDIRDSHKERPVEKKPPETLLENITTPLGNIYGNLLTIQDYNQDENFQYASSWFKGKLDFICIELPTKEQDISLSWHLTTREKKLVYNSVSLPQNQLAFQKLVKALGEK